MKEDIKILRLLAGMSVSEFGNAVGVSRQCVYDWENGVFTPSSLAKKQIERVAKKIRKGLRERNEKHVDE